MTSIAFPKMFEPIKLGRFEAKNRVMRVATTTNLADDLKVGPRLFEFYVTQAKGGCGTMVTESLRIQPADGFPHGALAVFDRASLPGLRKLADAVHFEGSLLIGQLNTPGRQHLASRVLPYAIAPSAIACPRSGGVPHAMSAREVREMAEWYILSGVHCIEAGMDGIEIHGAQGHLIQQFLSPYTNRRDDEYGGSFENRLRFARDIIEGVRRRIGPRPIVGYRMGVEEFTEGGLSADDTLEIAKALCASGSIDYLSLSQGNFNTIETHLPDRHYPLGTYRAIHARYKATLPGMPIVSSTRIQGPEQAEALLQSGEVDMIGLCRALIADPDWPEKARRGRAGDIRRCIACNQCWGWISQGEPIACATNPTAGREHQFGKLKKADHARRILVVGGGPGGLEATHIAAERGLKVTLIERSGELGGKMRHLHKLPTFAEIANVLGYLVPRAQKSSAEIRLNTEATAASILAENPDAVIVASGATPYAPPLPGDGSVPVHASIGEFDFAALEGDTVVVMDEDGYYWAAAIAEQAAAAGKTVVYVTRFFEPLRELPIVSRITALRALDAAGAKMHANMLVARAERGAVILRHYLTGREERVPDAAAVIWVGAQHANGGLAEELRAAGYLKAHIVGDAFSPRRLPQALLEAHTIARRL